MSSAENELTAFLAVRAKSKIMVAGLGPAPEGIDPPGRPLPKEICCAHCKTIRRVRTNRSWYLKGYCSKRCLLNVKGNSRSDTLGNACSIARMKEKK